MMKKLLLTAAFAGVVMFLAAGCCDLCKDWCGSDKKCADKAAAADKAACDMKTDCAKTVEAPAPAK